MTGHPKQSPEQNCRGKNFGGNKVGKINRPYGTPFIYNENKLNDNGYNPPKWVKRVERMASKKGQGRAALGIPRNKNSQKYQDFLQKKSNIVYGKFI
tara:strand:+ start:68 stop:358 length:291 start_codon:yes stop_codon:yes gene_type:complete